jgi:signal transduction histidine kinase/CheY-like chemotaxis protein/putative methionine-R-sulfoxide reductase with GAF domain
MSSEMSEPSTEPREAVERFEAVTDTALAQLSLDELLHELLVRVERILAADTAAIFLLDGDVLVERAAVGLEEKDTREIRIPVGAGFVGRVAAEKRAVIIEHVDRTKLAHPVLRESDIRSLLGVPILFEGRVIGVLHVGTLHPRQFRRDDAQLLQVVADRIGLGIEYSRLYEQERRALARSEAEQRRSRFLANVSALLATTLDYEVTLRNLARLAVPELGDWCVIDVLEGDGAMRRVAVAHVDPCRESLVWELGRRYPMHPDDPHSPAQVAHTGRAELIPEVTAAIRAEAARDAGHLEMIEQLGLLSYMVVPLVARGRRLGTLGVATSQSGRRYTSDDLAFTEEVAARAALAVDNARLYREAQETSRLKDEFLATLSHELRTPLTSVLAWMWMLRRGRLDAPAVERARDTMEKSIRSLLRIIDDLLDVSRAIRGQLPLDVRAMPLVPVLQAAVDAVRPAANAKGILLRTTIDSDAGIVQGDANRLQQVVWNLLTNAIKFTPASGRVHVRLERGDTAVTLIVSDSGPGVPVEFLPHVFERFRQADAGSTRAQGGLGLGLDIVRHLVELHGGTVKVESPGELGGATFTVTLPVHVAAHAASDQVEARPEAARPEPAAASATALDGARVLVVDDEADTREVLGVLLRGAGAEVRTSDSAAAALDAFKSWRPDVLVADIAMPGDDGYALLSRVRDLAPDTPALALTAYAHPQDRQRALAAGFHDYVAKPFEPPSLVAAIARLARARRTTRRGAPSRAVSTIMLVEDDPGTREYTTAVLTECGYRVLTACGGEEALRLWTRHRDEIDLIVTDLMMPRASGADVWRTLREEEADVPIIVVSGYPLVAESLGARDEGVIECLEKPVAPEQLAASVRRALARETYAH